MTVLVLLRHGASAWNARNLFTGWIDVGLNTHGKQQAGQAGAVLADRGLLPDAVHPSLQRRAITSADLALVACFSGLAMVVMSFISLTSSGMRGCWVRRGPCYAARPGPRRVEPSQLAFPSHLGGPGSDRAERHVRGMTLGSRAGFGPAVGHHRR